eukprot:gene26997-27226_t
MRAAARRYPDVVLHLNEELTGNMADQLLRGRVDVAVFSPTMPAEDIAFTPLVEEDFVFLESPQSPHALPPGGVIGQEAGLFPRFRQVFDDGERLRQPLAIDVEHGQQPLRIAVPEAPDRRNRSRFPHERIVRRHPSIVVDAVNFSERTRHILCIIRRPA